MKHTKSDRLHRVRLELQPEEDLEEPEINSIATLLFTWWKREYERSGMMGEEPPVKVDQDQ